jgi:hypothetical protein
MKPGDAELRLDECLEVATDLESMNSTLPTAAAWLCAAAKIAYAELGRKEFARQLLLRALKAAPGDQSACSLLLLYFEEVHAEQPSGPLSEQGDTGATFLPPRGPGGDGSQKPGPGGGGPSPLSKRDSED